MNKLIEELNATFEAQEKRIRELEERKSVCFLRRPPCETVWMPSTLFVRENINVCTWAQIAEFAELGFADKMFQVGSIKEVTLKNGKTINLRIIGFNHDIDATGASLPITFEMVDLLDDEYQMNEEWTNEGGWAKSNHCKTLNTKIYKLLPDDLKAVIKPCRKKSSVGEGKSEMSVSVEKLFILSEQEVFGRKIYSVGDEGRWYEWYKRENTPYGKTHRDGTKNWRWLRSPYSGHSTNFGCVNSDGTADYSDASASIGVAFGFCV